MTRVRVRGITATAVSKILVDRGYSIVQASNVVRERLNLVDDRSPADVTVKDASEDELLVLGFYGKADKVYEDLVESLEYVYRWVSPVGLYSVHIGVVRERNGTTCTVDLGPVSGVLGGCRHGVGDRVLVSVEKAPIKPGEKAKLSYRVRVVGEYVSLIRGSTSITLSEHIRDRSKREYLLAIAASKLMGSGLGVHFRSSSMYAERRDIEQEIDQLIAKLSAILDEAGKEGRAPRCLYEGEFIGILGITSMAKRALDLRRREVVPTLRGHHSLKTAGGTLSELVDFAEKFIEIGECGEESVEKAISSYIMDKLRSSPKIRITHKKPDGRTYELSPGRLHEVVEDRDSYRIVLVRTMRSHGIYDGLGVEKRAGDIDYMVIYVDDWVISHNYYRDGAWIGSYININTPPEILPGRVKYHDLLVDVAVKPGGEPEIVDREELDAYCNNKVLTAKLCDEALKKAISVKENIKKYLYVK